MASFSRRSQSVLSQTNADNALSFGTSRGAPHSSVTDPLQPLRAMADRVGKEVEKFAERVDHWHTHGNDDAKSKYNTTVKMVGKFRDLAESNVKELKKQSDSENRGELNKSIRRRIQNMADEPNVRGENAFGHSFQAVMPSIESSVPPESPSVRELRHWQAELATWELVRILIDHYHPEPGTDVEAVRASRLADVGGTNRYCPKNEIWDRFILEDDQAKEKKIILKWLQQTARNTENDIDSIVEQWEAVSGKDTDTWTNGWLDTKAKIKQSKRMQGSGGPLDVDYMLKSSEGTQPLITRLDPDAPGRQKRTLEKSDEYYENALWMICYEMLRRGEPWGKISEWCKERNEAWRGVSIGAAYEAHPDGGPNLAGSDLGYLFRRMCFYAARGARIPYEGAVYALLSGDLKQVQASSRTWDDHLYAYYNALLLSRFDNYLRHNPQPSPCVSQGLAQKFVFQDAVANVNDWNTSNKQVIELLKRNGATSDQAKSPLKLIQGALISGTVDELMYKVGTAIADLFQGDDRLENLIVDPDCDPEFPSPKKTVKKRSSSAEQYYQAFTKDPHALRILVHTYLILQNGLRIYTFRNRPELFAISNVYATYIEFLRVTKRLQLIPLYAAQLPPFAAAYCMAHVLPDIKNNDEQKRCVNLMEQYGIDPIKVLLRNLKIVLQDTGYVDETGKVLDSISKFTLLEECSERDSYLWPGKRISQDITGLEISAKEENLIRSLQWNNHVQGDDKQTFNHLYQALRILLLKGRIGAAEKLVTELSVENLSLARTTAYCGYAFDFTQPGAEEQDEDQVADATRKSLRSSGRDSLRPSEVPSAQEHTQHVLRLRTLSQHYFDLSQLVRLIACLRQWREEEEALINARNATQQVSTKRIKDLLSVIEPTFSLILNPNYDPSAIDQVWTIYKAYFPEAIIAYLSVLQSGSFFIHRDSSVKAMDLATIIADSDREWLQRVFLETGRMTELVDTLARVSKAMLKLGEHGEGKGKIGKKRGSRGETLKIWDINVRN